MLAIISPDFLKSPANKFFLSFGQAVGIRKFDTISNEYSSTIIYK